VVLRSRARPRTYELRARVAAGGMGEVYEAFSPDLNRNVAVKRMLDADASDDDLRLMFLREVAVAATLEHHNVVEVLDAGQNGSELFLVMEYVDGPSLAEVIEVLRRQNRILPVEISCHILSCVAQGLTHAHERALPDGTPLGIVHRDVAPENVLIGSQGIPKIVDFGLAKLSGHSLTQPGVIRGRPAQPFARTGPGVIWSTCAPTSFRWARCCSSWWRDRPSTPRSRWRPCSTRWRPATTRRSALDCATSTPIW
jgi:serine/threonine protein kinase